MGYIVVFGGCSWDSTYKQKEDLTYPKIADIGLPGGKGANQAVAIARAGYNVKMVSVIGEDEIGNEILKNLKDNNIDTTYVKVAKGKKSDGAQLFVTLTGDNEIKRSREAIDEFTPKLVFENAELLKGADFVVTQSKVPRDVLETLINFCYENKIKTVLTPCPSKGLIYAVEENKALLEKVTFVTLNEEETIEIMGTSNFESCAHKMPNLIMTAGKKGVFFCDDDGFFVNIPAIEPKQLVDTTGAGDTFCGNFLVATLEGFNRTEAVKRGVWAATLKLEHMGAQPGMPTKQELLDRSKNIEI